MKRYLIPILIILLLALGILTACATSEDYSSTTQGYIHYQNKEYGFSVDYSPNWELDRGAKAGDALELDACSIRPREQGIIYQGAFIWLYDSDPSSSIEEDILRARTDHYAGFDIVGDFHILSSTSLEGDWDWLVEYIYIYRAPEIRTYTTYTQEYFKKTDNLLYVLTLRWDWNHDMPAEVKIILDSFHVTESSFSNK